MLNRLKKIALKQVSRVTQHLDINNAKLVQRLLNIYPPYVGAGIHIDEIDYAQGRIRVSMALTKLNKNIVGTQFGGSLFSMTDPFMMLLLMQKLGQNYMVWDKSASIDFIKAGTSQVFVEFNLTTDEVADIIELAKDGQAIFRHYDVEIKDIHGEIVARVHKTVYIRLREFSRSKHHKSRI